MTGGRLETFRFGSRNQFDDVHGIAGVGVEDLVHGIERRPAPVHPASGHRKDQRALGRGRRVEPVVAQAFELLLARRAAECRKRLEHIGA
jgi:hypothetical protein